MIMSEKKKNQNAEKLNDISLVPVKFPRAITRENGFHIAAGTFFNFYFKIFS